MDANNIAPLRRLRNLSQRRLAEMIDVPYSTLCRIESGEIASFEKYRLKLAAALGCKPEDLDADELSMPTVPIIGIVKWKHFVKDLPQKEWEPVEMIRGLPPTAKAVKIKGSHLITSHSNGDILYFDSVPQENARLFLERECVVELDTKKRGDKLICWISPGSKKGHYMLHPPGAPVVLDAKVKAVFPVLHVKRG